MVRLVGVVMVLGVCAVEAAAARHGSGLDLQPVASGTSSTAQRPIWVDGQGRVVFQEPRPVGIGGGPFGRIGCFDSGTSSHYLDPVTSYTTVIATRRGQDSFVRVDINQSFPSKTFVRDGCTSAPVTLGSYAFPAGLAPIQTRYPWLLDAAGSIYYPSTGGLAKLVFSPALSASAVVTNAELAALVGVSGTTAISITALDELPGGRLVFMVQAPRGSLRGDFLVERTAGGALAVRWSRTSNQASYEPNVVYDATLDAVLFDRTAIVVAGTQPTLLLGVHPLTPPPGPAPTTPPWPAFPLSIVGGSLGTYAYDPPDVVNQPVYRVVYDPAFADFDRDGLHASREAMLGTSDARPDSDGDGLSDTAEVGRLASDPANAASGVPVASLRDDVVLASSMFAQYQPARKKTCPGYLPLSFARVLCCDDECKTSDGTIVPNAYATRLLPYNAPGTVPDHGFAYDALGGIWSSVDLATKEATPLPNALSYGIALAAPVSDTSIVYVEDSPEGNERLWRVSVGGTPFAVMNRRRTSCPIVSNATELGRCGAGDLFSAAPTSIRIVGFDPTSGFVLVAVATDQGQALYGVGDTAVTFLADLTTATYGKELLSVAAMSEGGAKGYTITYAVPGGLGPEMKRLDATFAPFPSAQPFLHQTAAAMYFLHGFVQTINAVNYLIEPASATCGCMSSGEIFVCDQCPMRAPGYTPVGPYYSEWIPTSPVIEKGEVILWSGTEPYLGRSVPTYDTTWRLWRITPLGATLEWLDAAAFAAQLSAGDQAALAATPLGPITAMGASPDATKLCLSESAARRTWELTLDPATRRLAGIRLALADGGDGCSYDEQGQLAVLDGARIRVGSGSLAVLGVTTPSGLHRFGGRWVVQAHEQAVRCVEDSGSSSDAAVTVTAMSAAPGGLAYIDRAGLAFVTTGEKLCTGAPPPEAWAALQGTTNLWSVLNFFQTTRSTGAIRAAMAMRPDGVAFLGIVDLIYSGSPGASQVITQVLFHIFPEFVPADPSSRIRALDPFRLVKRMHGVADPRLLKPLAMITLPGADPGRDWGYDTRPGTPNVISDPPMTTDGGMDAPPSETPPSSGCGCRSSNPGLLLSLAVLVLRRRRRA